MLPLLIFLLLLPLTTLGQWGTPPPVVTNQQCQEEHDKIIGCVRNKTVFARFGDAPLFSQIENQKIVDEITHILDCSGFLNCNSSRILQSFFFNQRWVIDHYYDNLQSCLSMNDLLRIHSACVPKNMDPDYKEDADCNRVTENMKCQTELLKKLPNCQPEDVGPYKRFLLAVRSGCLMQHQWIVEVENYKLNI